MFGCKEEEITGNCRKLPNEDFTLITKYSEGDKHKDGQIGWACGTYGGERNFHGATYKKQLGRCNSRWEDATETVLVC
jgi:hypothetical protein